MSLPPPQPRCSFRLSASHTSSLSFLLMIKYLENPSAFLKPIPSPDAGQNACVPDTTVSADGAHGSLQSQRHTERVRGGKATPADTGGRPSTTVWPPAPSPQSSSGTSASPGSQATLTTQPAEKQHKTKPKPFSRLVVLKLDLKSFTHLRLRPLGVFLYGVTSISIFC